MFSRLRRLAHPTVLKNPPQARDASPQIGALERRVLFAAGGLDPSFSNDGVVTLENTLVQRQANALALLSNGKSLVAGSTRTGLFFGDPGGDFDVLVERHNANGSLDTTFGAGGRVAFDFGTGAAASFDLAVRPDGKIVVVGFTQTGPEPTDRSAALAILNSNGTFDTTFGGGDGRIVFQIPVNANSDDLRSIAIAPGNKMVATFGLGQHIGIVRMNPDGSLDTTFSGDGYFTSTLGAPAGGAASANDLEVASDGSLFVTGEVDRPGGDQWYLAKVSPGGTFDTTFGGGADARVGTFVGGAEELSLIGGGKIVVSGGAFVDPESSFDPAVARFNSDGTLDSSFSGDGKATFPLGDSTGFSSATSLTVGSDNKIYLGGIEDPTRTAQHDMVVLRLESDGDLDPTWSGDGKAIADFFGGGDFLRDMALQSDGKLVGAGLIQPPASEATNAGLVRFLTNGSLDTSFSGDGRQGADFVSLQRTLNATAVQSDGKVIVGGSLATVASDSPTGLGEDFFLARYNVNGTLDTTFGKGGFVQTNLFTGQYDTIADLLIQPNGKIVALGRTQGAGRDNDIAVARYNTNGTLDTSFSGDGKLAIGLGGNDLGERLRLRSDGDILLSATTTNAAGRFAFVRLNSNGSFDTGLDGDGKLYTSLSTAFTLLPDNKMLVGDEEQPTASVGGGLVLTRLNTNGSVDTAYGNNGRSTPIRFGPEDLIHPVDVIVQNGAGLVLGSYQDVGTITFAMLARFTSTGQIDNTFSGDGRLVADDGPGDFGTPRTLALDSTGRIVYGHSSQDQGFLVGRLSANGTFDSSFGDNGRSLIPIGLGFDGSGFGRTLDIALMTDNRIYSVGPFARGVAVARLLATDETTPQPGTAVLGGDGILRAFGTEGVDGILLDVSGSEYVVTINGTVQRFAKASVIGYQAFGFGGNDTLLISAAVPFGVDLEGGAGNDTLVGSLFGDNLIGGDGNDILRGLDGGDDLDGGGDDDNLDGGFGADEFIGGSGFDVADYSNRSQSLNVSIGNGVNDGATNEGDDVRTGIEEIRGGSGNDTLTGDNANNVLRGNGGNDTIRGNGGDDQIAGGSGNDTLVGGDGNDALDGGIGADDMTGNAGTDAAVYEGRNENLTIGIGTFADDGAAGEGDNVRIGIEVVTGGNGNDTITGDGANNILRGNGGDDTLRGGGGNDILSGNAGRDRLFGDTGNDQFFARDGVADLAIDGGSGTDSAQLDGIDPRTSVEQLTA